MTVIQAHPHLDIGRLVEPTRVHGSVYTSPDVFEREMATIFTRGWVYVAHESEIPEPGDYVTRNIGRQPVIASRAKDGAIHVLANRCAHRGNKLCNAAERHLQLVPLPVPRLDVRQRRPADRHPDEAGLRRPPRSDPQRARPRRLPAGRHATAGSSSPASPPTGITLLEHLGRATTAIDRLLQPVADRPDRADAPAG